MKRIILTMIMLVAPAVIIAGAAESNLINAKAPEFTLKDQFDKPVAIRELEGHIVLLLASDKEGSIQNAAWQKAITDRYGDRIVFLGLANVSSAPFFLKGKLKNDFKKQEGGILLDWKGEVFTAYGLAKKVPNIILIDKRGYIRFMNAGAATPEAIGRLFAAIDAL